jgi:hypothetical protein
MYETEVWMIIRKHRPGQREAWRDHKGVFSGALFDGNMGALFPKMRQRVNLGDILR